MKKSLLIITFFLAIFFSWKLEKTYPMPPNINLNESSNLPVTMMVSMFNLESLMVGWLWLQFDTDSLGSVQNYHRLLATLDMITSIKGDEFHAWGLATFMRYKRYMARGNSLKAEESELSLVQAQKKYPRNYRGYYEVAYFYAFLKKDKKTAWEYIQQAYKLNPDKEVSTLYMHLKNSSY